MCVLGAWKNALGSLCSVWMFAFLGAFKNALGRSLETCVRFAGLEEGTAWGLNAVWRPVCVFWGLEERAGAFMQCGDLSAFLGAYCPTALGNPQQARCGTPRPPSMYLKELSAFWPPP